MHWPAGPRAPWHHHDRGGRRRHRAQATAPPQGVRCAGDDRGRRHLRRRGGAGHAGGRVAGTRRREPPRSCRCWPVDQAGPQRLSHQPWRGRGLSAILCRASARVPCASARTAPTPGPEGHAAWSRDIPHGRIHRRSRATTRSTGRHRGPAAGVAGCRTRRSTAAPAGRRRRTRSSPARRPRSPSPATPEPADTPNTAQNAGQNTAQGAAAYTTDRSDTKPGARRRRAVRCAAASPADRGTGHRSDRAHHRGRRRCPGHPRLRRRTPSNRPVRRAPSPGRRRRPAAAGTTSGATATAGASGGPSLDASGSPVPGLGGTPDPSGVVTGPVPQGTVTDCCGPARSG